jgi:Ser/Thr protein kinase RdoA (MazF antagonist)
MNRDHWGMADAVLSRYPSLASSAASISDAPSGHVTRGWRVNTGTGSFLLRRLNAYSPDSAAHTAQVHACAARAGLAPPFVANDAGEPVTDVGGTLYALTIYLDGGPLSTDLPDKGLCHQLGDALGRLHQQLREVPANGLRPWRLPGLDALREALQAHEPPDCPHPITRRVLRAKLAYAQAIPAHVRARLNCMDSQVIHGDIHPGNIVLTGTRPVFVDFDLARSAPPAYEVMRALIYCTHPAGPHDVYRDRVAAFLRGYLTARPLTKTEISGMVELYRIVQILDPYGLHACGDVPENLLRFGHARFALLYWLTRHGAGITALTHQIRRLTSEPP